jgi:hypothetical protein
MKNISLHQGRLSAVVTVIRKQMTMNASPNDATVTANVSTNKHIEKELSIRAGHIPSSHRKSIIDFIPQLIDFGITVYLTLAFIPTS